MADLAKEAELPFHCSGKGWWIWSALHFYLASRAIEGELK